MNPSPTSPVTYIERGLALGLSALLTFVAYFKTDFLSERQLMESVGLDGATYLYMAQHRLDYHLAPFCWRILVPWLAYLLPFGYWNNFLFLSFFSLITVGYLTYLLARAFGATSLAAASAVLVVFTSGWLGGFLVKHVVNVDLPALAFILGAAYTAYRRQETWFALLLAIGVAAKESVIFVAPLYYTFHARSVVDVPLLRQSILLTLPAIGVLAGIRLFIPKLNESRAYVFSLPESVRYTFGNWWGYDYVAVPQFVLRNRWNALVQDAHEVLRYSFAPLGLFLVLPWITSSGRRLSVKILPFLALVYLQLAFATNTERLLSIALPILVAITVCSLPGLQTDHKLRYALLVCNLIDYLVSILKPTADFAIRWPLHMVLMLALIALGYWRTHRSSMPSDKGS